MNTEICKNVEWVGCIDWSIRDFHGYETGRGSTYNAYLLLDESPALIDAVKGPFAERLIHNISKNIPLDSLRHIVCNHAEPDHSGALPDVVKACPNAKVVCNKKCRAALERHFDTSAWEWHVVSDGDTLSIGTQTLTFIDTPMVHWPESMFTYVPEQKILFSMDAFGQHYASSHRFDAGEQLETIMFEAKTYFANIVMLYGKPIARVMEKASGLDIDVIAPSHGIVWRDHVGTILSAYREWVTHRPRPKVLLVYDTMWKSTELMANAIMDGILEKDAEARLFHVRRSHITELATEALDSAVIVAGSPTLNKTLMPSMAAALTYLKGLSPVGKAACAFGSYGWSKGGAVDSNRFLEEMGCEILCAPVQVQFVPTNDDLDACRDLGRMLADKAIKMADEHNQ